MTLRRANRRCVAPLAAASAALGPHGHGQADHTVAVRQARGRVGNLHGKCLFQLCSPSREGDGLFLGTFSCFIGHGQADHIVAFFLSVQNAAVLLALLAPPWPRPALRSPARAPPAGAPPRTARLAVAAWLPRPPVRPRLHRRRAAVPAGHASRALAGHMPVPSPAGQPAPSSAARPTAAQCTPAARPGRPSPRRPRASVGRANRAPGLHERRL